MSSRQYFPRVHEPELARSPEPEKTREHEEAPGLLSMLGEEVPAYPLQQMGALTMLGLARTFEWQAAAAHVALNEWSRQQQGWLDAIAELGGVFNAFGLDRVHLDRLLDVARAWGAWGVTAQLAAAHGLASSCSPQSIGFPVDSGRRAGFDLGRRASAVVIDFSDRRSAA